MEERPSDREAAAPQGVRREWHVTHVLLAILVVLLGVGALKLTAPVTLPLAFALFLVAVFWPLQRRFERAMPRGAAAVLSLFVLLAVLALFGWALAFGTTQAVEKAPEYRQALERLSAQARAWAGSHGFSLPEPGGGGTGSTGDTLLRAARHTASFFGAFTLVLAFLVLGLIEVRAFRSKLDRSLGGERGTRWMDAAHRITAEFLRYIGVRTVLGLLNGVLAGLFCWLLGLDLAFVWGLQTFLLNYIPTIGSVVATVPPVLAALVELGPAKAGLVLLGLGVMQLGLGNYLDPLLQGRYLALSPFVVLLSVTFWGWVWGIAGAFISIPVTVVIVIACNQSDRTRWIAVLLSSGKEEKGA